MGSIMDMRLRVLESKVESLEKALTHVLEHLKEKEQQEQSSDTEDALWEKASEEYVREF